MGAPAGWEMREGKLVREFIFADFDAAMEFIARVADIARSMNHHPDIWNGYNHVRLTLSTHDARGSVTEFDEEFAQKVNEIELPNEKEI